MPRVLHRFQVAFACLAPVFSVLAIIAVWEFPPRGVIICTVGAAMSWFALILLCHQAWTDERIRQRDALHEQREATYEQREEALLEAVRHLSDAPTRPLPKSRPLRSV